MNYDVIIGFETHVELKTRTKLFCDCLVAYDAPPNSQVCPVCTGQPGALPVLNKKAAEYTCQAGLALNCTINRRSRFARKNYFYPDLPKGYQISQYERPFCENGYLEIQGDDGHPYEIGIKRIHLEEDAGKLVHSANSFEASDYSLVDYNRSSVPLMEIVTDHERNPMRSLSEARAYLEKLRQILIYIEISDCIIEKGQFRCDVNVSLRPEGSREYGNRSEIKNMASIRFIIQAIEFEIERQSEILQSGRKPFQETRLFDEKKRITLPMRSKEDAPDYRYFPDPDLVEVEIEESLINSIESRMPELPDQKVNRITKTYGITKNDALILTKDKSISDFFEGCAAHTVDRKRLSRWMIKDLFKLLNDASLSIEKCPVDPKNFAGLVNCIAEGQVTEKIARTVLEEMFANGGMPQAIIKAKGLSPIEDADTLVKIVDEVVKKNSAVVEKIRSGETKPIDFLIGQVMKATRGKAHPQKAREMILNKLSLK
ncbi:Asp-tRNA(Asn)/Glu-tRNA(Gln) amidotransferase subunit GatB [Thermodesulfobacteriota bacterium]